MRVAFFHVGMPRSPLGQRLAERMVQSVHEAMPEVPVLQFTHLNNVLASRVEGVDAVQVVDDGPLCVSVLDAFAQSGEGDWLLLDTDVVVQHDVQHVFDHSFDIAVATREGTLTKKEIGSKMMTSMPFNKGAVFSRSPLFWKAARELVKAMKPAAQAWMGDQRAVNDVIATGSFDVRVLENHYNYPPFRAAEDVSFRHIVHYKGPRKTWMVQP